MRKALLMLGVLALICSPAMAGKNEGGSMVVHTNDNVNYTATDDYCGAHYNDPGTCEAAGTRTDKDEATPAVLWFLAAFHETASPGVTVCYFGNNHNLPPGQGYVWDWGFCGPAGSLEVPDAGWPEDPANAGNSVAFGTPIVGNHLFPFYWFACYGFQGAYFGTGINPVGGYAAYVSDDNPGVLDYVEKFGTVEWYAPGVNECPTAPEPRGACCFTDGSCVVYTEADCYDNGGYMYMGDGTVCDPNPCDQPGACCFEDGHCEFVLEVLCQGTYFLADDVCDPNPCDQPPEPGACCFADGHCEFILEADCTGDYWLAGTECEPENPCDQPPEPGACCYENGDCVNTLEADCDGFMWIAGEDCANDPCPPVATETATWGSIKADYR